MIVTRKWLEEWIDISEVSTQMLLNTLNSIGLEVDSYKQIKMPKKVVVGYVKSKRKHEDADKLNICEVDVGSEILQIVCGAKNVEAGQHVAVALVGAELPGGLKIKKSKLRGVESVGMICSSTELGLSKMNDGIMVLDSSIGALSLGRELSGYPLLNDEIIEIELTPNRGDCLSIYGVARDLSAALDLPVKSITYEDQEAMLGIGRLLSVHSNENTKSFLQYRAFSIKKQLKLNFITKLRICSANIDKKSDLDALLAYVTYTTGVLLRSYDADKLGLKESKRIVLTIKEDKFNNSAIYLEDNFLSLVGVLQSDYARVEDSSKTIIIEANYTDPRSISKATSEDKSLKGDEHVYRSTRGSEPNLELGQDYLFSMISKIDGLNLYSGSQQVKPFLEEKIVSFSIEQINSVIGAKIERNDVVKILKKLGFDVSLEQDLINVKAPLYRHDIDNHYDVAEEIVRIIGIDNIISKPLCFNEKNRLNKDYENFINQRKIKEKAVGAGFFECIHYVFDSSEDLKKLGFNECKLKISNPISSELDTFRPTLINHMLKSSQRNAKNSKKSIKLFEVGKVFDENARESDRLAFLMSGFVSEASLKNGTKPNEIVFIYFASKVQDVLGKFSCVLPSSRISYLSEFEQAQIVQNGKVIGHIGRLDVEIENALDLPKTYICEIEFDTLKFDKVRAKAYSKFPSISRDISIVVPKDMRYSCITEVLNSIEIQNLKCFNLVDVYSDEKLGNQNSITINFTFQSSEKTLEDGEISKSMDEILKILDDKLDVGLR
ncbi:MAG: phenylalanine--tRNA ligase subunit beta [Campylobacter sp.]|nr:phenylalanine--tRNA ligase subunit beta [Campylobacter sp.]